ncbi:MAG: nitrate reductase [Pseudomonadota bacterium]
MTNTTSSTINTTCAYCGVGCGISISQGEETTLAGLKDHPANSGKLCIKGTHLLDTLDVTSRLTRPEINSIPVSWDEATLHVADKLNEIIAKYGPNAVAFYVSGQLLTEDYYVANKLMKGYIGSANIDTNSRLCMSSAVAAYKGAFGEDVVPCDYSDLDCTEYLILVGSNAAWTHPVLFQRMQAAKSKNPSMKIVVIDPRRSDTADQADMHLPLAPGSDAAIFNGLLNHLHKHDFLDNDFIAAHTDGFEDALVEAENWTISKVAEHCALSEQLVMDFYNGFAEASSAVTFYSMGINQSSSGVDKCRAIINAHLASGKILTPGSGPFSITGQPNAMGGREVGGLANQLTAHLDIENPEHRKIVKNYWQSPTIAKENGKKAVDMFDEVDNGNIKAIWIMATNPAVSLPDSGKVRDALNKCEMVIVSDCVSTSDTLAFANVKLPATGWSERDGTVTNSERCISRQRPFKPAYKEAKHDWEIMCAVAKKMGFAGFEFTSSHEVFDEYAQLTVIANKDSQQLNLEALSGLSRTQYDAIQPIHWPFRKTEGQWVSVKPFSDKRFSTENGRAKFKTVIPQQPKAKPNSTYPVRMNSGRVRDQWHTMTRTGLTNKLFAHIDKPYIQMHPSLAKKHNIRNKQLVRASNHQGQYVAHALLTNAVEGEQCFVPIHWNKTFASASTANALFESVFDPISGQPESKHTIVNLEPVPVTQYGEIYAVQDVQLNTEYWVKRQLNGCVNYAFENQEKITDLLTWAQTCLFQEGEWLAMHKGTRTQLICLLDNKLVFVAFIDTQPITIPSDWVAQLFTQDTLPPESIRALLHATPDPTYLLGPLVCVCHQVHENEIVESIKDGLVTVDSLGEKLKCGTNCGSCRSVVSSLIDEHRIKVVEIES